MSLSQETLLKETSDHNILTNRQEATQAISKIYEAKKVNYALNNTINDGIVKGSLEEIFSFNKSIERNFQPDTLVYSYLNTLVQKKELEFLQYFLEKTANSIYDTFLAPKGYVIRDENMKTILFSSASRIEKIFPFASSQIRNDKELILQARGDNAMRAGLSNHLSLGSCFKNLSKNLREDEEMQFFAIADGLPFSSLPKEAQHNPLLIKKGLEQSLENWTFLQPEYKTLETFLSILPITSINMIPQDLEDFLVEQFKDRNTCISILEKSGILFPYAFSNYPLNKTVDFGIVHAAIKGNGYNIFDSIKEKNLFLGDYEMSLIIDTLLEKNEFSQYGKFSNNYYFEKFSSLNPIISTLSKKAFLADTKNIITMEEVMISVSITLKDKAMREDLVNIDNSLMTEPLSRKPGLKF